MNGTDLVSSTTTVPAGGMTLTAWFEQIDTSHTDKVIIRYWSDGVRINTEDLTKGETLWDPGAPAVSSVDTRHFVYWSATPDGDPYSFGHAVNTDVNLYAVWKQFQQEGWKNPTPPFIQKKGGIKTWKNF